MGPEVVIRADHYIMIGLRLVLVVLPGVLEKLARMLLDHLEGILNYCRTKVPMGVIEAVNGNIQALLRRGRGYRDLNYLLLKAQLATTKTEFVVLQKAA